jgi:hypothetical protein
MMEDNDEEENDDNYPEFPETTDTAMEDTEEEGEERASDVPADDVGASSIVYIWIKVRRWCIWGIVYFVHPNIN